MKLFIDDERMPVDNTWTIARTFNDAIDFINNKEIEEISFDHDLGQEKTGYDIASYIEKLAYYNKIKRMSWTIHSANPVGRKNIELSMNNADRFWSSHETQ